MGNTQSFKCCLKIIHYTPYLGQVDSKARKIIASNDFHKIYRDTRKYYSHLLQC